VAWNLPSAWVFLAMAVAVLLSGAVGWRLAPSGRERRDG
jgi:predicted small integral membrane protein